MEGYVIAITRQEPYIHSHAILVGNTIKGPIPYEWYLPPKSTHLWLQLNMGRIILKSIRLCIFLYTRV